jgi:2-keto-3-deoxy-galactonokinase
MARTGVLSGAMDGSDVAPFLSGLLIGTEAREASRGAPPDVPYMVFAGGIMAESYLRALNVVGISARVADPRQTFVSGLLRIARAEWELTNVA